MSATKEFPTLGLTPGSQITHEQWDIVLEIDNEWRAGFPKETP